jgi:hypothetical protein
MLFKSKKLFAKKKYIENLKYKYLTKKQSLLYIIMKLKILKLLINECINLFIKQYKSVQAIFS